MTRSPFIRVFVVDDHPLLRTGLHTVEELSADIRIIGEAGTASDAIAAIAQCRPDVVLLDIRLGKDSGTTLCRQIKTVSPTTRVIMLTSYLNEHLILSALEAGADGYLLKENDSKRLVSAIQEAHRGEAVFDPEVTRRLAERDAKARDGRGSALDQLSAQERRLLAEVARGKTDKEAAAALGLSPKTVRNYLDRIFSKLGVHTRTEAATTFIKSQDELQNWG
ncbi:MAG: response regulator transcription factor [Verrucomicrobiales bacterium]|nr:response regulator transcription factor [Verrucomicrobiales bacterium]